MTDWNPRANEIFLEALDVPPGPARARLMDEACGGDAGLRAQVESLLGANDRARTFLESPAPELGVRTIQDRGGLSLAEAPATVIGPYKLLEQIGEGGMGVVFMAEQVRPVRRRVALKVIKAGMDTEQVIARFEAERQALALMDHPNIARVFDAGATDGGRPYFVMELVEGVPITRYCDGRRLAPRERLELFAQVCQAVQHAHQKGVIHRDLKPTNVLVAVCDGRPVPKVIDFGVAKAVAPTAAGPATTFTRSGDVVGTPEYMSPEQAEPNQIDIDTRSDVYSLGALLYELLTGTTPIERARLKEAALLDVLRIVREEDPPRPSVRLSSAAGLPGIAADRGLGPERLRGLVRGELDWIVMKALEKDRARRYGTADGLGRDVERYLRDEPVQAGPPSAAYRFRKFARRHRAALAAAAAMLVLLVGGIAGTTAGMLRARAAERDATAERNNALALLAQVRAAQARAERAAGRAQALSGFLTEAFGAANPKLAGGDRNVKVADVLDRAAARLSTALAGQPEAEIDARLAIGRTYTALGLFANATSALRPAYELAMATYGPEDRRTLEAADQLTWAMVENGGYREAEPLAREALAAARRVLGTSSPITWDLADTYGYCLTNGWRYGSPGWQARLAESLPLKREVVEWVRSAPDSPAQRRRLAEALHAVAIVLIDQPGTAGYAEALRLQREAITLLRQDPAADPYPRIHTLYGRILTLVGRLDESRRELEAALAEQRARFGDAHETTLTTRVYRAHLLLARGEHAEAADAYQGLIDLERAGVRVRYFVPHDAMLARLLVGLGRARLGQGEPDDALRAATEALELARAAEPEERMRAELQMAMRLHGVAEYRLGDCRAAVEALERSLGLVDEGSSFDWFILAMAHWRLGERDRARVWHERAVRWMEEHRPRDAKLLALRGEAEALIVGPPASRPATGRAGTTRPAE